MSFFAALRALRAAALALLICGWRVLAEDASVEFAEEDGVLVLTEKLWQEEGSFTVKVPVFFKMFFL